MKRTSPPFTKPSIATAYAAAIGLVCTLLNIIAFPLHAGDVRNSVVKLHVTQRGPDLANPWKKAQPREGSGSGVIIGGQRILTNAHVVTYAQRLTVTGHQSAERVAADVEYISYEMDLAIVKVRENAFFKNRPPLPIADKLPKLKDTINAYGFPIGGQQMSVTEGIVSRIEYVNYNGDSGLRIQVDAALNPGNSGGPAVVDDKIVGLVFSRVQTADNIGYLIPAGELRYFLQDIKDQRHDGKWKLLDRLQTVENQALRKRLKLNKNSGGLMVNSPYLRKPDYPLKAWDVITHIAGKPIDKQGNIDVEDDLKLSFRYWVPRSGSGGKVPLTIWRAGHSLQIELPLHRRRASVVQSLRGRYPRHFIVGSLSFSVASHEFINALGGQGQLAFRLKRNPTIARQFDPPAFAGEELVMLGARFFSHSVTQGYGPQPFAVVAKINQVPIKNLTHLVETIRDAHGEFLIIELAGNYETLVFDRKELLDATEQILEDEGIRKQFSDDLRPVWNNKE